jgi:hypothetical protein
MPLQSPGLATKKAIALNRVNMPFALETKQAPFLQHPRTRLKFNTSWCTTIVASTLNF